MPNPLCPNIKTDILTLRSKIGELSLLKTQILQGDTEFEDKINSIKTEIDSLIKGISAKQDTVANETVLRGIKESREYKVVGDYSEGRAWVQTHDGDCFHIDLNGKPLYTERYKSAGYYSEGRAWVQTHDGDCFHIDLNGKPLYTERYKSAGYYSEGRAWVQTHDGDCFHIDLNGKPLYTERYESAGYYYEGRARVVTHDGDYFHIDLDGKRILE
jgi:uncharacterized protein YecT (DUF1311 family)